MALHHKHTFEKHPRIGWTQPQWLQRNGHRHKQSQIRWTHITHIHIYDWLVLVWFQQASMLATRSNTGFKDKQINFTVALSVVTWALLHKWIRWWNHMHDSGGRAVGLVKRASLICRLKSVGEGKLNHKGKAEAESNKLRSKHRGNKHTRNKTGTLDTEVLRRTGKGIDWRQDCTYWQLNKVTRQPCNYFGQTIRIGGKTHWEGSGTVWNERSNYKIKQETLTRMKPWYVTTEPDNMLRVNMEHLGCTVYAKLKGVWYWPKWNSLLLN